MGWKWGIDEAADNDIELLLAPNFLLSESQGEDILVVSSSEAGEEGLVLSGKRRGRVLRSTVLRE